MKNEKKKLFISLIILTICFSLSLVVLFFLDTDYFWHIKAGEYMFKKGIIKHDVFSWYVNSKYWMSHEWLFEIFIYSLKLLFGKIHVYVYSFISITFLLFILLFTNKRNYLKNIPFTFLWYLLFFCLIIPYIQARPHLLSFSFLSITIYVLFDLLKNENSKKIYFLPILSIIWSNYHGGSSNLIYILCFIFLIGGCFKFDKSKIIAKRISKKQFFKYFIVSVICMIGICINVHSFKMLIYPYVNMLDKTMISNIAEWRGTSLNEWYHYVFYIFIILNLLIMLFNKKKIEFIDLLLFGFVAFLGLKSIRFWIYLYIVMSFIIFNYVEERKIDRGTNQLMLLVSGFLLLFFISNFNSIKKIKYENNLDKKVVEILHQENPKRLYNMYDYGGELIYNNIKVFIDGRADLYSKYNYKDYLDISLLHDDYVKIINKYNFDYFLVDVDYPINSYLKYNSNYTSIYSNKKFILYKKEFN